MATITIKVSKEFEMSDSLREKIEARLKAEQERGNPEMYWQYDDELSDEQIATILKGPGKEGLWEVENEISDNNSDYIWDIEVEHLKNILNEFEDEFREEMKLDEDDDFDAEELAKELRDEFLDYLGVDMNMDQLIRNTGDQVFFYDTGHFVECQWENRHDRARVRAAMKRVLKIKGPAYDKLLNDMMDNASYGGELVIYCHESITDMMPEDNIKSIQFKNPVIAIVDHSGGSGADCTLKGHEVTYALRRENIILDSTIKYNYSFEVCGMSSDWCSDTEVSFIEKASRKKVPVTPVLEHQEQEAKYNATFKDGGCTYGDMDINRHRNTTYINDYPCGHRCKDCNTFWID